jgi:hypothetical protein
MTPKVLEGDAETVYHVARHCRNRASVVFSKIISYKY